MKNIYNTIPVIWSEEKGKQYTVCWEHEDGTNGQYVPFRHFSQAEIIAEVNQMNMPNYKFSIAER